MIFNDVEGALITLVPDVFFGISKVEYLFSSVAL
jgi:hypothetical protein